MKDILRRLAGFTSLPVISALTPLIALPIVARVSGAEIWIALTVGQAIGTYASTVGYAGWNVLGTPLIAQQPSHRKRRELYARSFYVRAVVVALLAPITVLVSLLIAPPGAGVYALVFALASLLSALGINWYAVGIGSPRTILLYELTPRVVGTFVALPLVLMSANVMWYGLVLLLCPVIGLLAFHLVTFRRLLPKWVGWRTIGETASEFRAAWSVEATGNLYSNAPLPIASALGDTQAVAGFATSDKLYRYSLFLVSAAGNSFQGWVLERDDPDGRNRRNRAAFFAMLGLGATGGLCMAILGEPASRILFGDQVAGSTSLFIWFGVAFCAVSTSTPIIRNTLIPARRERQVFLVTIVSAIVGIFIMVCGTVLWEVTAVAVGLAVSEIITLILCVLLTRSVPKAGASR